MIYKFGNGILYQGDALDILKQLPDEYVYTCVTSPPYWQKFDYGLGASQLGHEKTPQEYIDRLVLIFREVKRVLKSDGTFWLNIGDTFSTKSGAYGGAAKHKGSQGGKFHKATDFTQPTPQSYGYKNKEIIGLPWKIAFALQNDGWYLRQDIIWYKPNSAHPEHDKCVPSHEYLFLLTKQEKYYFDVKAIHEHGKYSSIANKKSVWIVNPIGIKKSMCAEYPTELIEPCIEAGCPEGQIVLDPFFGSGTTGYVCERYDRKWVGIEANPEYYNLAKERISAISANKKKFSKFFIQ